MKIKLYEQFVESDDEMTEIKSNIFDLVVDTYDKDLIDFFLNKKFDINSTNALYNASFNDNTFRYLLSKGADVNELTDTYRLRENDVQKALIDYGHDLYVKDTVGFNSNLKDDPKYSDIINASNNMNKYNL